MTECWYYPRGGDWKQLHPKLVAAYRADPFSPYAEPPSYSLMMQVIRENFPYVRVPLKGEWKDCPECVDFRTRSRRVKTTEEKIKLEAEKKKHRELFAGERRIMVSK